MLEKKKHSILNLKMLPHTNCLVGLSKT